MFRILPLLLLAVFFSFAPLFAAEPPKDPILRIEAGAHTAKINRVTADAAGRLAVTAANDKTARLYEVASGRLLRTFRPPVGAGDEGKLYAVALSPDGGTVAVGGWTGWDWEGSASICLFDAGNGRLLRRVTGLPSVIRHLTFSPDGRQLAAALGDGGIRVFRAADGSEAGRDADYGSDSYSVHFAADGRLVATSYDGFVRLYDRSFRLVAKEKAPGGTQPFAARFSPDGTRIAVGYQDSTQVDVLAGETLAPLFAADTAGVGKGDLGSVAWSAAGRTLFAGGMYDDPQGLNPIRRWRDGGRGKGENINVGATNTFMDLVPLPDGALLFAAADPALGVLAKDGQARLLAAPPVADYRGNREQNLRLTADGDTVRFWYRDEKSYARFNAASRDLLPGAGDEKLLAPPRTAAPGLEVTGWKNAVEPKLNGAPLQLEQYEMSRALAVAPDGESFVLGADWSLRRFAKDGKELWQRAVPGTVWGVNIPANGGVVVAAYGDGTIRWHRLTDGEELLAFFPHADRKRWVLWTPSGYYDASVGGEELIGWHVNNGKDREADFFPASKFRATYYRPDIVSRVLTTLNEDTAIAQANAAAGRKEAVAITQILPPVVTLLSPLDGGTFATADVPVRFALRTPEGSPVTNVRLLVDGRPLSQSRGIDLKAKSEGEREIVATLPPRDCEVTVIAENANASSVPATVRLRWAGAAPQTEEFAVQPKLYVLSVGVSEYADPSLKLGLAAKDAKDFAAALEKQKGLLYRDVVAKVLTDTTATKDDVLDGLDWLQKETTSKDVAVLFLAGHGVNDPGGIYYYLPQNADTEKLKRTGVPFSDIKNTVASLAGKALFFVDTCHSGNVMGARRAVADINAVVNELSSAENGAVVFASSTGRQYSLEDPKWGNGAFTKALVEGLAGKADYGGKGKITVNMLDLYLSERVKELTGGKQTPTTTKPQTIQDFPIAVRR